MKLRLIVAVLLASQVFAQMKYRFQSNGTAMGAGITMLAQYRWQDAKNERVLIFDSIDVTIRKGRQIESHYRLDRSGWTDFDERAREHPTKRRSRKSALRPRLVSRNVRSNRNPASW